MLNVTLAAIYNHILTESEVWQLYNAGDTRIYPIPSFDTFFLIVCVCVCGNIVFFDVFVAFIKTRAKLRFLLYVFIEQLKGV